MKDRLPSFSNRVLSVLCVSEDTGQLIADPKWEMQGGRLFLIGTVPKKASQDNWMKGLTCAIAWDTVQDYVVFASIDDYLDRLESGPRKKRIVSGLKRDKSEAVAALKVGARS